MEKGFPADAHDAAAGGWTGKMFPADAHDAGRWAVDWKKGFPADAHDAGRGAVDSKTCFQLMLMMLAAGRWIGQRVSS